MTPGPSILTVKRACEESTAQSKARRKASQESFHITSARMIEVLCLLLLVTQGILILVMFR